MDHFSLVQTVDGFGERVVIGISDGADRRLNACFSPATYFNWKKKYDGLLPTEMRRLKQLEDENAKLKRIVADLLLGKEMLQDLIRRKL